MSLHQMAIAQIINRANGIRGYTDETRLRGFEFFRMMGVMRSRNLALKARIDKLALCDRILYIPKKQMTKAEILATLSR
ncbi:hypothetical protein H6F50_14540 [Coleofasciculus sp. FACHB-712]|uniref:hypothetical protein n=1 Tax=Coleofasciculus sp. FACHB-712 TaxID=2692789 RepID=UPI001684CEE4|nr:hypothetical protein [Coleofasciculus sp. FACHB-712]MBD1943560.1 hypothetical protein [Coleofasciculus sp. FACHB-712]